MGEPNSAPVVPGFGRACLPSSIVGFFYGALQPHLDQMQHAPINNPARHRLHQLGMGDAPEGSCHTLSLRRQEHRRGPQHLFLDVGAVHIDEVAARALLAALAPLGVEAALAAAERIEADHDGALAQSHLAVGRAGYDAQCAERRYRASTPTTVSSPFALSPSGKCLRELEKAEAELARREQLPQNTQVDERIRLLALGADLFKPGSPTTSPRDKKELLRTLLRKSSSQSARTNAARTPRCVRGAVLSQTSTRFAPSWSGDRRTDEDTIALVAAWLLITQRVHRRHTQSSRPQERLRHRFTADLVSNCADVGASPVTSVRPARRRANC